MKPLARCLLSPLIGLCDRLVGKRSLPDELPGILFVWIALLGILGVPAFGQEVIVHHLDTGEQEEGNPKFDADGVKNGVLVWKGGGTIHVVGLHTMYENQTLKIEQGAIVKIAGNPFIDTDGRLHWSPPGGVGMICADALNDRNNPGVVQIDGAVITDIRDDEEGGDTNQDGNATRPMPDPALDSNPIVSCYRMEIRGSNESYIKNSTVKYCQGIRDIGSMRITGNRFIMFGTIKASDWSTACREAVPDISNNVFEFASGRDCGLWLEGTNPIVQGNTFRYAKGFYGQGGYLSYSMVRVGQFLWSGSLYPKSGTTIIQGNLFQTIGGIGCRGVPPLQAEIRDNRFERPAGISDNYYALDIDIAPEVLVSGNTITDYPSAMRFFVTPGLPSKVTVTGNRMLQCKHVYLDGTMEKGSFVDAKYNYWGDPTGPLDRSNQDGLYNPRGKGAEIPDGIDYVPFLGGTKSLPTDAIQITAFSTPAAPLLPNAAVTFNVAASYQLQTSSTGKIAVRVRDKGGSILNFADQPVAVTSQNSTVSIPEIQITAPEVGNVLTLDAALVPDGPGEQVVSNVIPFSVNVPVTAFTVLGVRDAETGQAISPVQGEQLKLKVDFRYTYTPGPVTLEVVPEMRRMGNGQVLTSFTAVSQVYPAATNRADTIVLSLDLPLQDAKLVPRADLCLRLTMKTQSGAVIGKESIAYPIEPGGTVAIVLLIPRKFSSAREYLREYLEIGDDYGYAILIGYTIKVKNVTNWQVWIGCDEALDAQGKLLYLYTPSGPASSTASTGSYPDGLRSGVKSGTPLPPGTRKLRVKVELRGSGGILVAWTTQDIPVRDAATQFVEEDVAHGASTVSFAPIPATLKFSSNQKAGIAVAEEFAGQFGAQASIGKMNSLLAVNDFYWDFIPLTRYWAVYDTLQDGTFSATLSFTYDAGRDFPATTGFLEDSLVVAGLNPLSNSLEALQSTLDKAAHTITTPYTKFFTTWVVASRSTTVLTGVPAHPCPQVPARYVLEQNFPNPFNPTTVFSYQLPAASNVRLVVYDLIGREVSVLVNERKEAGSYTVQFISSNLASGVYFYRLQAGSFVDTKKLLLLR